MPADPSSSPALRASDADRDRVIELLRAAVADGGLDPAEFDQWLDAALAARTIDALAPLTADLIAAPGSDGSLALPLAGTPAEPAAELLTIRERHGSVRRDGRWMLPHRLVLRPTVRLVHLLVHASWLNQVEIYFSVIERKVLTPSDFASLAEVEDRLLAFERRYEQAAVPFEWKFTRHDLALLMKKLAGHQAAA